MQIIESPADSDGPETEKKAKPQPRILAESLEPSPQPNEFEPGWHFYASFISLCIITLAVALDATSISVALPIISRALHGTAIEAFWSGTAFLLSSTVFQPTFASLSQLFGRKPLLLVSLLFFTVGAIVCATSQQFPSLLTGRTIQGIGAGGVISLTEILITDLVPLRERGKWFAFQSLTWAIGSVTGPLIGGAFAQDSTWRWIFWINMPFCGLGFLTIPFCLRLRHPPGSVLKRLSGFDWGGAFLLTASTTSFLMPVSWGGVLFLWSSYQTLLPLFLSICGLIGFTLYEIYITRNPLIPLRIFYSRTAVVNYIGTLTHGTILWCLLYYLPLYYEAVKGYSPIISGVAVFPETFTVTPASIFVGVAVSMTGRYRWSIWSGWIVLTLGMGLLYLLRPGTSIAGFVFLNLVPGLGCGLLFASMNLATQAAATEKYAGYAAGMYIFMRSLGQGIGVAVGGVVFQSRFAAGLRKFGSSSLAANATALAKDASSLVQIIKAMPKDAANRKVMVKAYSDALNVVWAVMAGLAFVALVLSFLTKGLSLDAKRETGQGLNEKRKQGRGLDADEATPQ